MTHIYKILDTQFPNRECSLGEATHYLVDLLKDHKVNSMNHSFLSTDGQSIELSLDFDVTLRDGRTVNINSTGWYNGGNPQTGMDLINNFSLLEHCDNIVINWMET